MARPQFTAADKKMAALPPRIALLAALATASAQAPPPPPAPRLTTSGRSLLLDGQPHLVRGVAYSPTPIGTRPSASQGLDFFHDGYSHVWQRDIPRMAAMGVNTIRLYTIETEHDGVALDHTAFFDACAAHNISVFASFELLSAVHRLDTEIGFTLVNADLIKKLTILNHPAVVLWFVGNELNLPSTGWACNVTRAEKLEGDSCQFGGAELHDLYGRVNELCAQVVQRGKMCASPLADFSLPGEYQPDASISRNGNAIDWWRELETVASSSSNMGIHAGNIYRPLKFSKDYFYHYAGETEAVGEVKPLLISE